ncbi:hypothetical protein Tco_0000814 [Tanacetum coccineum]
MDTMIIASHAAANDSRWKNMELDYVGVKEYGNREVVLEGLELRDVGCPIYFEDVIEPKIVIKYKTDGGLMRETLKDADADKYR